MLNAIVLYTQLRTEILEVSIWKKKFHDTTENDTKIRTIQIIEGLNFESFLMTISYARKENR